MNWRSIRIPLAIIVISVLVFGIFGYFIQDIFIYRTAPPTPEITRTPSISEGKVAHWTFDEGFNDTLNDSIGDNDCTIYGATWITGLNYTDRYCPNGVLEFDGDDYVEKNLPTGFQTLNEGSISLWFKVNDIPLDSGIRPILHYGDSMQCMDMEGDNNRGLIIEVGHSPIHAKSKRLYITEFNDGCVVPSFCFDTNKPIFEGKWYHFVAVIGEDFNTGYLNGEEMEKRRYNFGDWTTSEFFADALSSDKLWIGKGFWAGEDIFFNGQIDDIRIYNKPLSSEEVSQLYNIFNNTIDTRPIYDRSSFVIEKYSLLTAVMTAGAGALLSTITYFIVKFIKKRRLVKKQH